MFKFKVFVFSLMVAMTAMSSVAFAVTLIPYQDEWNYVVVRQLRPLNDWQNTQYSDVNWDQLVWKTGQAGFSNSYNAHSVNKQTPNNNQWSSNTFLLLEKTITYDELSNLLGEEEFSTLYFTGYIDNALALFINGTKVEYYYAPDYNSFSFVITNQKLDEIWNYDGDNVFHIIAMDHGYETYFDMQVTTHPTPIPASVLLLGTGLAGLVGIRRRSSK